MRILHCVFTRSLFGSERYAADLARVSAAIVERFWETARRLGASVEGVGYDICAGRCARRTGWQVVGQGSMTCRTCSG